MKCEFCKLEVRRRGFFHLRHLSALFVLLVFFGLSVPTAALSRATKIIPYVPAQMKTKHKLVKGFCWTDSLASLRADAFRCTYDDLIRDPCFYLSAKAVACPEDIASNTGIIISLTKPLPLKSIAVAPPSPLGFRIGDGSGMICRANGSGITIADKGAYRYYCSGNNVCTLPGNSVQTPKVYRATCGVRTGYRLVTGARTLFVRIIWR